MKRCKSVQKLTGWLNSTYSPGEKVVTFGKRKKALVRNKSEDHEACSRDQDSTLLMRHSDAGGQGPAPEIVPLTVMCSRCSGLGSIHPLVDKIRTAETQRKLKKSAVP